MRCLQDAGSPGRGKCSLPASNLGEHSHHEMPRLSKGLREGYPDGIGLGSVVVLMKICARIIFHVVSSHWHHLSFSSHQPVNELHGRQMPL